MQRQYSSPSSPRARVDRVPLRPNAVPVRDARSLTGTRTPREICVCVCVCVCVRGGFAAAPINPWCVCIRTCVTRVMRNWVRESARARWCRYVLFTGRPVFVSDGSGERKKRRHRDYGCFFVKTIKE